MATRTNYRSDVIDKQEQARRDYNNDSQNEGKKKTLKEASDRVSRSLAEPEAGSGRGTRPPYSKKWTE